MEKRLRLSLTLGAKSTFMEEVISELFNPDPLKRISVQVAYTLTQQLLKICVVKLNLPWIKVAPCRRAFWRRLQEVFAKQTGQPPSEFGLIRSRVGSVHFQFRILSSHRDAVLASLQLHAADKTSVLRQDVAGQFVTVIKKWELSDGEHLYRFSGDFVFRRCS